MGPDQPVAPGPNQAVELKPAQPGQVRDPGLAALGMGDNMMGIERTGMIAADELTRAMTPRQPPLPR